MSEWIFLHPAQHLWLSLYLTQPGRCVWLAVPFSWLMYRLPSHWFICHPYPFFILYCNDTFLGCVFRTPRLKKKPFSFFYVYFWILVSFPVSSSELYLYSAYGRSAFALLKHWNKYFLFFVISPPYFPLWNERQFMKKHSSFCGRREYLPSSDDFLLWKSQICKPLWVACCQINVHIGDVIP